MVGRELEKLRESLGWTARFVEKLSRLVAQASPQCSSFSRGYLRRCESGATEPGIRALRTLSVIYHRTIQEMAQRTGSELQPYELVKLPVLGRLAGIEIYRQGKTYSAYVLLQASVDWRRDHYFDDWRDIFVFSDGRITSHLKNIHQPVFYFARGRLEPKIAPRSFVMLDELPAENPLSRPQFDEEIYIVQISSKEGSFFLGCGWGIHPGSPSQVTPSKRGLRPQRVRGSILGLCGEPLMRIVNLNLKEHQDGPGLRVPISD